MSLASLIPPVDEASPDDPVAVYDGDREISRVRLRDGAHAVAGMLSAAGLRQGQAVAVLLPTSAEIVTTLFATWFAGGVYVPVNPRLTDGEVANVVASTRPAVAVVPADQRGRVPHLPAVVWDGQGWEVSAPVAADAAAAGEPATYDDDVALVQFTSGTTGRPKAVLLRHSGVLALLDPVLESLRGARAPSGASGSQAAAPRRAPMPNLIPTSLSLWAGLYNVLFAFRVGAPVVLMERFNTRRFADLVSRFGLRSTVLPPAAMAMLTDDPEVTSLSPLRFVRSITAPLSPLSARRFRDRFGVTVLNCYGQTEIGGEIVGWNAADARAFGESKLGSVGRPHEGVSLRIVPVDGRDSGVNGGDAQLKTRDDDLNDGDGDLHDRDGDLNGGDAQLNTRDGDLHDRDGDLNDRGVASNDRSEDRQGELWVRTPALSAGYADGADLGDRLSPDGWFRTGDIGHVDADGFLWIDGRVSDMVNRGGLKVFPAEVEEVLRLHPDVAEAAVVGVPDDRLGEVPWAFLVGRPGSRLDEAALADLCRAQLAPYKVPVRFVPVDELPRNEVGKVLARDLVAHARTLRTS